MTTAIAIYTLCACLYLAWHIQQWETDEEPDDFLRGLAILYVIWGVVLAVVWPVVAPTAIVIQVRRWIRRRRWTRLVAQDRGLHVRWWHGIKRISRAINSQQRLPYGATRAGIRSYIYDLTGGCPVRIETEPGHVIVVPKRRRDWRKVLRAVKRHRDRLVGPCDEISVRIPKRRWRWRR